MANKNYDRNRPKYEWGDSWEARGITEKQINYIGILIEKAQQRGIHIQVVGAPNRGQASGLIDELKRVADYGESPRYLKRDWSTIITVEQEA